MNKEIQWELRGFLYGIAFIIVVGVIIGTFFFIKYKRIRFMSQFIPRQHAKLLIEWTDYYKQNWLKVFTMLTTESEYDFKARGLDGELGYFQLIDDTRKDCRERLKHLMKDTSMNNPDFVMASGALTFRFYYNYSDKDLDKAIRRYNAGLRGYRQGRDTDGYCKKWMINYEHLQCEYRTFFWSFK